MTTPARTTHPTRPTRRPGTLAAAVAVLLALVLAATGCSTTMRDLPIPGTGVPGDTVQVRARFAEALNLAVGAPVKVNGVDLGKVEEITVEDFVAEAVLTLQDDAQLREGARARLRYTTPLGELFVDVTNPAEGTLLGEDAVLDEGDTATAPTVEDALAQASLLINGGGLDQLQTVTEELNTALSGNEGDYRRLLDRATVFLTRANATTESIDQVLTSLASLSSTLASREDTIDRAVREIRPAARVLRQRTPDFTRLLAEVERFSRAANGTVDATREQLLTLLKEIEPVLAEFARNNTTFEDSLRALVKGASIADEVVATDYLNISLELHLDSVRADGLLDGTVRGLLGLLGFDTAGLDPGSLLDLGGLLGLGRGTPTAADPRGFGALLGSTGGGGR